MLIWQVLILIFFSFILIKSAEWIIVSLRRIAKRSKVGVFAISAIILAVGTSLPEFFVGITSAIEGVPNISLGVVLGSNIANTALITGLVTLILGKINVHGEYLKRDVFVALVAGLLPLALMADGILGRVDGLVLLFVYASYTASFFKDKFAEITNEHGKESFFYRFIREVNHIDFDITKEYGKLFIGLALMLYSSQQIIGSSEKIAISIGIPVFVVGLIILAIGTSLPELVFSLRSIKGREPKMFFGNLLGSTIANSTLIVGLTAVISPITITSFVDYRNAIITFTIVFVLFWIFIKSKHRLDRVEGLVLVLIYLVFVIFELLK
jgi:cation:H+ antiporter